MLSKKEVYTTLTDRFVCVRFDWEQGNHFKDRFDFILGTGDQMILDPTGNVLRPDQLKLTDKPGVLFGRHGCDTTGDALGQIVKRYPGKTGKPALSMDWFFWTPKPARRPGGSYPPNPNAIANFEGGNALAQSGHKSKRIHTLAVELFYVHRHVTHSL